MGLDNPRLSIVTVCLNRETTLPQALRSVREQDVTGVEHIVVDGGSTDGSLDHLKEAEELAVSAGIDFRWLSEPDKGIYDAMNKGLRMARGEIIGILNSDDYYEPDALKRVINATKSDSEAGIFYGYLRVIMENGKELQTLRYRYENYLLNLESGVFAGTQHPTCFVRNSVYKRIGMFDTQFPIAADYDFLIRAMRGDVGFHPIDEVLCNFRLGGASDRMNDYERFKQRDAIMLKNMLITEAQYAKRRNVLKYQRYKMLKQRILRLILRA